MDYITDNPHNNNEESKADEIGNRLRHEESGELSQEPRNESLHIIHESAHPQAGKDNK